jgi:hydantoinase/carbamoylase family amidase
MDVPTPSLERIRARLEALAEVGRDPAGGITRLPCTPAHDQAVRLVAQMMRQAGLECGVDEYGILVGWRPGPEPAALLCGSHLDTVPQGGMFDGALGVVAAVECAQALQEAGVHLRHGLAVVAFADEEGAAFGLGTLSSRALVGEIAWPRLRQLRDEAGRPLADCLRQRAHGLPPARVPDQVAAYLELHIEQGPVLEAAGHRAAAVTAIVGIARTGVVFTGRAQHAGTTPMDRRADALAGAARLALDLREMARRLGGSLVATAGRLQVHPGAVNVIPGRAELSVEVRSPDPDRLREACGWVEARARDVAGTEGLQVQVHPWDVIAPQPLDPQVRAAIRQALRACGHPERELPSWAGHDAGVLARYIPAGMIFVPSAGGISHSPLEHTPWEAVEAGVRVLLQAVLALDASPPVPRRLPVAYDNR